MIQRQCACGTETFHMYLEGNDVIFMCTECELIAQTVLNLRNTEASTRCVEYRKINLLTNK